MSYKKLIHDALMEAAAAGVFRPVKYAGRVMLPQTTSVAPATIEAWEESANFNLPARLRRDRKLERQDWSWRLFLQFASEVSTEEFEESMCDSPILIPRQGSQRQITLNLSGVEYEHPPRNEPAVGTKVIYTIEAQLAPI